jgi:hypothetical protein
MRLLERVEAAGAAWAKAEYEEGIDTGRLGAVSVRVRARRDKAEATFRDVMASPGHASLGSNGGRLGGAAAVSFARLPSLSGFGLGVWTTTVAAISTARGFFFGGGRL